MPTSFDRKTVSLIVLSVVSGITLTCQCFVFWGEWQLFAISLLVGTAGALSGALAGFLISPRTAKDQARFDRVTSVIAGLITGYALAKVIDPVVTTLFQNPKLLEEPHIVANLLIATISFLSGFMGVYTYRVELDPGVYRQQTVNDEAGQSSEGRKGKTG